MTNIPGVLRDYDIAGIHQPADSASLYLREDTPPIRKVSLTSSEYKSFDEGIFILCVNVFFCFEVLGISVVYSAVLVIILLSINQCDYSLQFTA